LINNVQVNGIQEFAKADRLINEKCELLQYCDSSGRKAVHYAAASGHLDFVRQRLSEKPELSRMADDSGWTLLIIAASAGHTEIVRLLLETAGTDVNHRLLFVE
jgi:ankyrin repeat protein